MSTSLSSSVVADNKIRSELIAAGKILVEGLQRLAGSKGCRFTLGEPRSVFADLKPGNPGQAYALSALFYPTNLPVVVKDTSGKPLSGLGNWVVMVDQRGYKLVPTKTVGGGGGIDSDLFQIFNAQSPQARVAAANTIIDFIKSEGVKARLIPSP